MNILTLSGWGQKSDSLNNIAPNAEHIDYSSFNSVEDLFISLKDKPCDILIGWSLGGQIALRLIDEKILKPKYLVLLATPFQFIKDNEFNCGMDTEMYSIVTYEFRQDPVKFLTKFAGLIAQNDSQCKKIRKILGGGDNQNAAKWSYWFEQLEAFSCKSVDFEGFPKALIIHGQDDTVIDVSQTAIFTAFIEDKEIIIMEKCGHAPHLHDEEQVRQLIKEFCVD